MLKIVIGIIMVMFGAIQLFNVYRAYKSLQKKGTASTSAFMPLALWSATLFGISFVIFGFAVIFNWL
ncbi:immunity protein [Agrilactobacillus fermenti]|uniref:immunity protein n=1 Tax=Agrilactobacillus fermenti TaxID=2586909 RepID=UPI001E3A1AB0|nr:immunity protein [Agrilactobacillus fermenti]MCD2257347.1 immunity protein [Agrilactobacillus fermenti]